MSYRRILVPVDGSSTSNKALVAATDLAREFGAKVRLMHTIDELALVAGWESSGYALQAARDQGTKVLAEGQAVAEAGGVAADTHLVEAPGKRLGDAVADEAAAWGADLVVVGTHGRRGLARVLLGSGAESVIRLANSPVLVVRAAEVSVGG